MSSARSAMAVGIVALVLGAAALGFTVYQGFVSVPNQFSGLPQVNQTPNSSVNVTLEWTTALESQQDRFFPDFITIAQGDTVNLLFMTNDTADGHTFTIVLPTSRPGFFQLNNSLPGQHNFLNDAIFTTQPNGCSDQNGTPKSCNTVGVGGFNETSTGTFQVMTSGTFRYWCQYHQKIGMYGWLIVLPNKGFNG
ncbi:hypothetical protein AUG19_04380 [archaeon 13_1_20CM_2_54_9]|nr:MAG: hypothetical protein AUG19_04380 [archaeon 13_1_20CM_2_54_9]